MPAPCPLHWDLYCRVIDNFGDVGVCWRLAADLASRGHAVRLVIDDPTPLDWMAPAGAERVRVQTWPGDTAEAADAADATDATDATDGIGAAAPAADVVIEAFGCNPPACAVQAMAARAAAGHAQPVWVNLEYLSAEPYVERSHGLPSPQRNGLMKWFFYPGFTPRTGGLLREAGLLQRQAAFDRDAWLAAQGLHVAPGERVVSLFCYDNPALPALLASLGECPTLLLLTPGPAQRQVATALPGLRLAPLPWLSQHDFDHLLWASDFNIVRGEDSLVRATWAGAPWLWQAYPQRDGAHHAKVQALVERMALPRAAAQLWQAFNGLPGAPWPGMPPLGPWREAQQAWRDSLSGQPDLATQLEGFVRGKSRRSC